MASSAPAEEARMAADEGKKWNQGGEARCEEVMARPESVGGVLTPPHGSPEGRRWRWLRRRGREGKG